MADTELLDVTVVRFKQAVQPRAFLSQPQHPRIARRATTAGFVIKVGVDKQIRHGLRSRWKRRGIADFQDTRAARDSHAVAICHPSQLSAYVRQHFMACESLRQDCREAQL